MLEIHSILEEIGEAVMTSLYYRPYPTNHIKRMITLIDEIRSNPAYLKQCEEHLKSEGSNYVLFFLSNIIYNLKKQGELTLTNDIVKWLGSVWINFLKRNLSYQELFSVINEYKVEFKKYYPNEGSFVNQLENVNLVKLNFGSEPDSGNQNEETPLKKLEKFYQSTNEIITAMKPTYYFLLDFYYERKFNTGKDNPDAVALEVGGITKFGHIGYTYGDLCIKTAQSLGILEAAYLILKKRKSARRIINIDGRQKFLTTPEIYNYYLEKFNFMKKELKSLFK
jgi:hypothetical protein